MNTQRFEILAMAISKMNGAWDDPDSRAFKLRNPLLLKTFRPEKKCDSENYRIFTSFMGGFKAGIADLSAKCTGQNHRLSADNTLKDILAIFGFANEMTARKLILFIRRGLQDDSISLNTPLKFFQEMPQEVTEDVQEVENGS